MIDAGKQGGEGSKNSCLDQEKKNKKQSRYVQVKSPKGKIQKPVSKVKTYVYEFVNKRNVVFVP